MSRKLAVLCAMVTACGSLPLDGDGGLDASPDVSVSEAGVDAPIMDVQVDHPIDVVGQETSTDTGAPSQPWGQSLGLGLLYCLTIDAKQEVIVGGKLTPQNGDDRFFVSKLDSTGAKLWANEYGTSSSYQPHFAYSVAASSGGDVFATGFTNEPLDVGGGAKGPGTFAVKYDTNGAFQWEYGPFNGATFFASRVKSNGNLLIAGELHGSIDFGGGTVTTAGDTDALIVELTPSGSYVRAKAWGNAGSQRFTALALDSSDDIFVAGLLEGSVDFGGGAMQGGGQGSTSYDAFVLELDATGNYLHQNDTHTMTNGVAISGLATSANGHVYASGFSATGTNMTLGGNALDCGGAVAAELDASLAHVWSNCHSGGSANGIAANPSGGAVLAGSYQTTIDFGQGSLTPYHGAFLAAFDGSGKGQASYGTGSSQNYFATAYAVAYLAGPDFVMVGQCSDPITLPSGQITCGPNGSAFVARLPP